VHEPLSQAALIEQVLEGVSEANSRTGKQYCVTHIRYIENDTKPEAAYGFLALRILERVASGGEFPLRVENAPGAL
jgi:hypothetical protein